MLVISLLLALCCVGCGSSKEIASSDNQVQGESTDTSSSTALEKARQLVKEKGGQVNIVATSPAVVEICHKLDLDLCGVSTSSLHELPKRYQDVTKVGTAMSPDLEIIGSLDPDWILSPVSLISDLQPKYEQLDSQWAFLNLNSVEGMYESIDQLGYLFDREKEAQKLLSEYKEFLLNYQSQQEGKESPKVLILMGLPGSYVIATEHSYVGSLVAMAGGENVYTSSEEAFINVNTEDMKTKEPDVILRAAHALPDQVTAMFEKDFKENDIWQHFKAVQEGKVYDLSYDYFGMSANFEYQNALKELQQYLYDQN